MTVRSAAQRRSTEKFRQARFLFGKGAHHHRDAAYLQHLEDFTVEEMDDTITALQRQATARDLMAVE